jgi:hypothetical protein
MLGKIRRGRFAAPPEAAPVEVPRPRELGEASWEHTARPTVSGPPSDDLPLRSRILSLFADPRVEAITFESAARTLAAPRQDIETTLDAMVQAGELVHPAAATRPDGGGGATRMYRVPLAEKQRLEAMFRDAAHELGEQGVLVHVGTDDALATVDEETEEPRLPVTAGLLSLFLPGTGQLLNGDVGRASLVFAVWSLAWITHLSPVWTFVCLYAGAEAFFTAKIRSMERKLAKEALAGGRTPPQLPPKPSQT